jgi:probable rRNA maturation factor
MSDGDQRARLRAVAVDARGRPLRMPGLTRWLVRIAPARARGTVSIALVSDARVRALNRQYRRKDDTTDVLSFPVESSSPPRGTRRINSVRSSADGDLFQRTTPRNKPGNKTDLPSVSSVVESFLGDIVIARGVARRQARGARHSELTELRVLALHGLLHLLGYDHERDDGRMRQLEHRLRRKGGLREGLIERTAAGTHVVAPRRRRPARVERAEWSARYR